MALADAMHAYFRGEKLEAFAFILPIGMVLLAFAAVAIKVERPGFAWGVAIPCILFGLVVIGTGWVVGSRTAGQVAELDRILADSPVGLLVLIAGLGFMIDGFAERRARVYSRALSELSRDNPIVD
jgi:hypothetical protein